MRKKVKKKKKKKASFKNMLAGMMEGSGIRDVEKEKESIQKITGGGAFVKIDKIWSASRARFFCWRTA